MNQRIWTNEEDEYIKNNFGSKTFSEMAEHIGCAITTVQNRAKILGFEVDKKTARRWNEEEIELLKIMAPKYLNKTIARKLNRSINELNKKARELGIELIFKGPVWKKWKVKEQPIMRVVQVMIMKKDYLRPSIQTLQPQETMQHIK